MSLAAAKWIFSQLGDYVTSTCHVVYRWRRREEGGLRREGINVQNGVVGASVNRKPG